MSLLGEDQIRQMLSKGITNTNTGRTYYPGQMHDMGPDHIGGVQNPNGSVTYPPRQPSQQPRIPIGGPPAQLPGQRKGIAAPMFPPGYGTGKGSKNRNSSDWAKRHPEDPFGKGGIKFPNMPQMPPRRGPWMPGPPNPEESNWLEELLRRNPNRFPPQDPSVAFLPNQQFNPQEAILRALGGGGNNLFGAIGGAARGLGGLF